MKQLPTQKIKAAIASKFYFIHKCMQGKKKFCMCISQGNKLSQKAAFWLLKALFMESKHQALQLSEEATHYVPRSQHSVRQVILGEYKMTTTKIH